MILLNDCDFKPYFSVSFWVSIVSVGAKPNFLLSFQRIEQLGNYESCCCIRRYWMGIFYCVCVCVCAGSDGQRSKRRRKGPGAPPRWRRRQDEQPRRQRRRPEAAQELGRHGREPAARPDRLQHELGRMRRQSGTSRRIYRIPFGLF